MAASGKPPLRGALVAHLKECGSNDGMLERLSHMLCSEIAYAEDKIRSFSGAAGLSDAELAQKLAEDMEKEERQRFHDVEEQDRMLQEFLTTCQICGKVGQGEAGGPSEKLNLSSCDHILCRQCARQRVVKDPRTQQQKDYLCPVEGCMKQLEQHDVKAILTDDEYDMFLDSDLSANMGGDFRRCPAGCGWGMLLEDASPAQNKGGSNKGERGLDGKPLSAEAAKHRDQYRIRCRRCPDTEFCAMCNHSPYHIGFTCQGFKAHQAKRKCRYCGEEVMPDPNLMVKAEHKSNKKSLVRVLYARGVEGIDKNASIEVLEEMVNQTESLVNLCREEECLERAANACRKIAPCGHMCMGTKGEAECLGCLECNSAAGGQAADDLCNICYVEEIQCAPSVQLKCKHIFHRHCIVKQLQNKWNGARVTFGFLECPLCKEHMDAEPIRQYSQEGLDLYSNIKIKAEQRLALENNHKDAPELQPGGRYEGQPVKYAMHKFAYYMCYKCKSPYFGGYRSCEVAAGEGEQNNFIESELVCGGCSAAGSTTCLKHGSEAIEHKCKFCCTVASWFCWGTTHFCDSCHRKQGTPESMSRKPRNMLPVCTPDTCPLKIPHPPNGEEFVLGCQICRSASFC